MGIFPRPGPDGDSQTKTHFDITATGIFKDKILDIFF
jgi:hypothetical protein